MNNSEKLRLQLQTVLIQLSRIDEAFERSWTIENEKTLLIL